MNIIATILCLVCLAYLIKLGIQTYDMIMWKIKEDKYVKAYKGKCWHRKKHRIYKTINTICPCHPLFNNPAGKALNKIIKDMVKGL